MTDSMKDSILNSVKEDIGISPEYTDFDKQLIRDINTALMIVYQLGYGDSEFKISSADDSWTDFAKLYTGKNGIGEIKTYVSNRVRQLFDPAGITSSMNNAINEQNRELEWRINAKYDRTGAASEEDE